uniref:Uncharacterized protein n=1 Tax=Tetraselmis sp. GSL018 TaxID=582737 RepID=A0A061SDA9_9CHLO
MPLLCELELGVPARVGRASPQGCWQKTRVRRPAGQVLGGLQAGRAPQLLAADHRAAGDAGPSEGWEDERRASQQACVPASGLRQPVGGGGQAAAAAPAGP